MILNSWNVSFIRFEDGSIRISFLPALKIYAGNTFFWSANLIENQRSGEEFNVNLKQNSVGVNLAL